MSFKHRSFKEWAKSAYRLRTPWLQELRWSDNNGAIMKVKGRMVRLSCGYVVMRLCCHVITNPLLVDESRSCTIIKFGEENIFTIIKLGTIRISLRRYPDSQNSRHNNVVMVARPMGVAYWLPLLGLWWLPPLVSRARPISSPIMRPIQEQVLRSRINSI